MSGFEVAGIILGALPLVISAAESYGKGLSTIQRWRRYEREVQSLVRILQTEASRLQTVCEKLLMGIVPSSRIEAMIRDPALWHDHGVQQKIRARLWKSSPIFEKTLLDMQAAIDDIKARMQPHSDGSTGVLDFKRVAFTLRRSSYVDELATIARGNSSLENLVDRNMELEPARRVIRNARLLNVFRNLSRNLYGALVSSMSTCPCQEHQIGLRLEAPLAEIGPLDQDDQIAERLDFWLALSYDQAWEELVVKTAPSLSLPSSSLAPLPTMRPGTNSVTFGLSTTIHPSVSFVTAATSEAVTMSTALCREIRKAQKSKCSLDRYGVISSPDKKFVVHPAPTYLQAGVGTESDHMLQQSTWSVISLHDVLGSETTSTLPHLSYRHRLQLAVVIASSTLHLYGTPWFPGDSLGSRQVTFLMRADSGACEHAFVMRALSSNCSAASNPSMLPATSGPLPDAASDLAAAVMQHINTTLLALGVVLIELLLGKTLASCRTQDEELKAKIPRVGPAFADFLTARRLLPDVRRMSSNYGSAVSKCLEGEFHLKTEMLGLENETLRNEVYDGVVALLEKDLNFA